MLFMKGRRVVAEPVRNRKKERNNSLLLPSNKIALSCFFSLNFIWFHTEIALLYRRPLRYPHRCSSEESPRAEIHSHFMGVNASYGMGLNSAQQWGCPRSSSLRPFPIVVGVDS
jgi:hypothetical protein